MKKILLYIPVVLGVFIISYLVRNNLSDKTHQIDTQLAQGTLQNQQNQTTLEFNGKNYASSWILVDSSENINLINNLDKKLVSSQVYDENSCDYLVSAGFYTDNAKPVGYLKTEDALIREFSTNRLFNSVLSVNYLETPRITRELPQDQLRIGVQTGPLLIENSNELQFDTSDDPARRIVAGVTGENKLVFIVIYSPDSSLLGPVLSDLTEILAVWQEKSGITLADATNLDGGSASAFITENTKLVESSKVGSFFCYK